MTLNVASSVATIINMLFCSTVHSRLSDGEAGNLETRTDVDQKRPSNNKPEKGQLARQKSFKHDHPAPQKRQTTEINAVQSPSPTDAWPSSCTRL